MRRRGREKVGADQVELVTHSTTQAVNALLEGDVGTVGIVGMGRRPELAKARKRTELAKVELSAGKHLATVPVFLDVTDGLDESAAASALRAAARSRCLGDRDGEAFAPDDASNETRVAADGGEPRPSVVRVDRPVRAVRPRAARRHRRVNASILPIALRTASHVEEGVHAAGIDAPVMVMRGDGGATDLAGFKAAPVRTLYSGPAASVAGALRYTGVRDGIVVEVGGTSTNVAASEARAALAVVRHGRIPRHRAARRRRARDRCRRRIDAPRSTRQGVRRRAPLRAHRRAPATPASPTRRASTVRDR